MKQSTIAKLILLVLSFAILIIVSSCGAEYHLRKAKRHIALAGELGAEFKKDTIYKQILIPPSNTDTSKSFNDIAKDQGHNLNGDATFADILHDTITIETTKWKTKTVIDTLHKKVFQTVYIKGDTIKVPVEVNNNIQANGVRQIFGWISLILTLIIILIIVIWRKQSTGKA